MYSNIFKLLNEMYKQFEKEWSTHWFEFVSTHIKQPWQCHNIFANPYLTFDMIEENITKIPISSWEEGVSFNSNITWDIVQKYPEKCWDWRGLCRNKNFTWEIVRQIIKENPIRRRMCIIGFSLNPNLTWNIVQENIKEENWNWYYILGHENMTLEIMLDNPYYFLPWNASHNPNITIEFIKQNPNSRWEWSEFSRNEHLTLEIIKQNLDKTWDWDVIGFKSNITWEMIQQNPELPWNYVSVSGNPNITLDIILDNYEKFTTYKHWDWFHLSHNSSLTFDDTNNHPDIPWNIPSFGWNSFTREKDNFIRSRFRDWFMGKKCKDYDETSLFRELMERVWRPENLHKFDALE